MPFVAVGPMGGPIQVVDQERDPPIRIRVALGVLNWARPPYSDWECEAPPMNDRESGTYNAALSVIRNYLLEENTP